MTQSPELVIVTPEATPQTHEAMPPVANHSAFVRALDKALAVQRPVVLAHIRSVRLRHPEATPAQLVRILERRYLLAVTGGGAAVGAAAVIPAVSTPVALALSGVETVGFLETTALFAQSVAEVHGIHVENPDRARLLVMTLPARHSGVRLSPRHCLATPSAPCSTACKPSSFVTSAVQPAPRFSARQCPSALELRSAVPETIFLAVA